MDARGLGAPTICDAGGFSQTSPTPAWRRTTPLVLFTRQVPVGSGEQAQAATADPATGDVTLLAHAASIVTPAVAHSGDGLVVAWPVRPAASRSPSIPDRARPTVLVMLHP